MGRPTVRPTGRERTFHEDEIIVSKTDLKGVITYANQVFVRVAGYSEQELLGQPHNLIRHPDMPKCVFKLLWDTISQGNEIFVNGGEKVWRLAVGKCSALVLGISRWSVAGSSRRGFVRGSQASVLLLRRCRGCA